VNLKNGRTVSYDLTEKEQLDKWNHDSSTVDFQSQITAIGIIFNSQWFALPTPKKFRQLHFGANLVESKKKDSTRYTGERIQCFADDVLISVVVYWGHKPKMSRIDVIRVGRRRFNPELKMG